MKVPKYVRKAIEMCTKAEKEILKLL